jgi:hypothetical protein
VVSGWFCEPGMKWYLVCKREYNNARFQVGSYLLVHQSLTIAASFGGCRLLLDATQQHSVRCIQHSIPLFPRMTLTAWRVSKTRRSIIEEGREAHSCDIFIVGRTQHDVDFMQHGLLSLLCHSYIVNSLLPAEM